MSALDVCEPAVIRALKKDGWRIAAKPRRLVAQNRYVFADFSLISNQDLKEEIIIVEVKCFTNTENDLSELYNAVGQYLYYRAILLYRNINLPVYLALPYQAYQRLIQDLATRILFYETDIYFVIIDIEKEEVVEWIR